MSHCAGQSRSPSLVFYLEEPQSHNRTFVSDQSDCHQLSNSVNVLSRLSNSTALVELFTLSDIKIGVVIVLFKGNLLR
jgi:hypothetical protein